MKFAAIIFLPSVMAAMLATPAAACNSDVANNPYIRETVVHVCPSIPTDIPETAIAALQEKLEPKPVEKPKAQTSKPKAQKAKAKKKKRCWYTNKKGQRKYRMRYSCS